MAPAAIYNMQYGGQQMYTLSSTQQHHAQATVSPGGHILPIGLAGTSTSAAAGYSNVAGGGDSDVVGGGRSLD